jgi:hypothetical protein
MKFQLPNFTRIEWILLVAFVMVDVALLTFARKFYSDSDGIKISEFKPVTVSEEFRAAKVMEKIAQSGSWQKLEQYRTRQTQLYLDSQTRPSRGIALYFFPEILDERSLEREFADHELKPGIEALRYAYESRSQDAVNHAFESLESRVENYELSANDDTMLLSPEADLFLKTYKNFTGF